MTVLELATSPDNLSAPNLVLVGRREALAYPTVQAMIPEDLQETLNDEIEQADPGNDGVVVRTLNAGDGPRSVSLCLLPERCSRHNAPSRAWALTGLLGKASSKGAIDIVLATDDCAHVTPLLVASARAFPLYSRKSGSSDERTVSLLPIVSDILATDPDTHTHLVDSVRLGARLVDMPTQELDTTAFAAIAREEVEGLAHVTITEFSGDEILEMGLGGLHAVGRTAVSPPRMVIMEYRPEGATRTIGLVGKGLVYDSGGLNLKKSPSNMKMDMGGAAAVMGGFRYLASSGAGTNIVAALMLAENAIGPNAYRPDDILAMHSGKTVEINNTDAEGRLALADGVSYLSRNYELDAIIDLATLTGAQLVATGRRHGAVVSNREEIEQAAILAGRSSGDLVAPLPFCPELLKREFASKVADMRNSVKDRANAQSSCAAQFVYNHIEDLDIPWLHVDLAGPAFVTGRGTGFGVALLGSLVPEL